MTLQDDIQDARRTHSIESIVGTNKRSIVCPLPMHNHANNTPSFSIFWYKGDQYFRCHGNCGLEGDVIDLVGYLRISGYDPHNKEHIRRALKLLDDRYEKVVIPEVKQNQLKGSEWMDFTPPGIEAIEYAKSRGLTVDTLTKFRVGQSSHWMTIPAFEEGRLRGIKMRNLNKNGLRYMSYTGSHQALFNFDAVFLTSKPVFLVKGEIPCMLLDQLGFLACAPTGGEAGWRENWRLALALAQVIVIGDNDETGREMGKRRADFLHGILKFPAPEYKDVDEWLLAEPKAIDIIRRWQNEI